jgi:hypothetical protein
MKTLIFYPNLGSDELTIVKLVYELRQSVVWDINAAWIGSYRRFGTTYRWKD